MSEIDYNKLLDAMDAGDCTMCSVYDVMTELERQMREGRTLPWLERLGAQRDDRDGRPTDRLPHQAGDAVRFDPAVEMGEQLGNLFDQDRERLDRIEAMLRTYQMHAGDCIWHHWFSGSTATDQEGHVLYRPNDPRPCDCWLSEANPSESS